MNRKQVLVWGLAAAFVAFSSGAALAEDGGKTVKYPDGYRNWTHVKSMVIQEGHPLYEAFGGIHHIYANDQALKALKKGLPYPKNAVLVFDLLEAKGEDKAIVEGNRKVLGVMQRDAKRFAGTGGWGFEGFKGDTRERVVTDMKTCFGCHEPQKGKGYVFSTYRK
jgi:hypothetical protein